MLTESHLHHQTVAVYHHHGSGEVSCQQPSRFRPIQSWMILVYQISLVLRIIHVPLWNGLIITDSFSTTATFISPMDLSLNYSQQYQQPVDLRFVNSTRSRFLTAVAFWLPKKSLKLAYVTRSLLEVTAWHSVLFQRLWISLLSYLAVDLPLRRVAQLWRIKPSLVMFIYGTSFVPFFFFTRPLNCTIEAMLLSLLLYLVVSTWDYDVNYACQLHDHSIGEFRSGTLIGALVTVGFFNRPAFLIFTLAPFCHWLLNPNGSDRLLLPLIRKSFGFTIGCGITGVLLVLLDSDFHFDWLWEVLSMGGIENLTSALILLNLTVTPINNIRENLDFSSLASESIHPWYTHAVVHIPTLFGVIGVMGLLYVAQLLSYKVVSRLGEINAKYWLFLSSFAVPLIGLSIYPHHDIKDLSPLLIPLIYLGAIRFSDYSASLQRKLMFTWVTWNFLAVVYTGLHQSATLHCTNFVQNRLSRYPSLTHSYLFVAVDPPPPQLLIHNAQQTKYNIEHMKVPQMEEIQFHLSLQRNLSSNAVYLVLPTSFTWCSLTLPKGTRLKLVDKVGWSFSRQSPPSLVNLLFCHELVTNSLNDNRSNQCRPHCFHSVWRNLAELLSVKIYRLTSTWNCRQNEASKETQHNWGRNPIYSELMNLVRPRDFIAEALHSWHKRARPVDSTVATVPSKEF